MPHGQDVSEVSRGFTFSDSRDDVGGESSSGHDGRSPQSHGSGKPVNVGHTERLATGLGGGVLALFGLGRRSTPGALLALIGGAMVHRAVTGHCSVYSAMGVSTAHPGHEPSDQPSAQPKDYFEHGVHVEQATTIAKPADELFRFWRDFANLPKFMRHLKEVKVIDEKHSHWTARGPAGTSVDWDAEIINEEPDRLIAWRSLEGANVDNAGSVRFATAPDGRGTEVRVVLDYIPPAGKVGSWIAKLFLEEPNIQVREDLRRFKQVMEAGEVPTVEGQPMGE